MINIASSISKSPASRNGMQPNIKMFDTKNIAFAGS